MKRQIRVEVEKKEYLHLIIPVWIDDTTTRRETAGSNHWSRRVDHYSSIRSSNHGDHVGDNFADGPLGILA